jgi:NADH:ubiquinone oxidoreductase subunit D
MEWLKRTGGQAMKKTKIEIRGVLTDWKEVKPEQAWEYVKLLKRGITNLNDTDKNKYINSERLRGTTVEELEKCTKQGKPSTN